MEDDMRFEIRYFDHEEEYEKTYSSPPEEEYDENYFPNGIWLYKPLTEEEISGYKGWDWVSEIQFFGCSDENVRKILPLIVEVTEIHFYNFRSEKLDLSGYGWLELLFLHKCTIDELSIPKDCLIYVE